MCVYEKTYHYKYYINTFGTFSTENSSGSSPIIGLRICGVVWNSLLVLTWFLNGFVLFKQQLAIEKWVIDHWSRLILTNMYIQSVSLVTANNHATFPLYVNCSTDLRLHDTSEAPNTKRIELFKLDIILYVQEVLIK